MLYDNLETKLEILHLLLLQEGVTTVLESKDPVTIKLLEEEVGGKSVREHIGGLPTKDESEYLSIVTMVRDHFLE